MLLACNYLSAILSCFLHVFISLLYVCFSNKTDIEKIEKTAKQTKAEKKKQKQLIEDDFDDFEEEIQPELKETNDGSESPRTSALRAMGVHASNVIDIMQTKESEPVFSTPQESLSPIEEENELESSGSMKRLATLPTIMKPSAAVPKITVDVCFFDLFIFANI